MDQWNERVRPNRLEKRFEFKDYEATREFLDKLGRLSEENNKFPDISFGKTYVNLTLMPDSDANDAMPSDSDKEFASKIDLLVD